jgi:hypothetical protein
MGITFREAVAEVELGLVSSEQLPDIATAGLLEGYESAALGALAGHFGEPFDPIEVERLWSRALQELRIPGDDRREAARVLVRAYARLVVLGELPPQLGASKIAGVHRVAQRPGCDRCVPGDCLDAAQLLRLFFVHDGHGYPNSTEQERINAEIVDECRRLIQAEAG